MPCKSIFLFNISAEYPNTLSVGLPSCGEIFLMYFRSSTLLDWWMISISTDPELIMNMHLYASSESTNGIFSFFLYIFRISFKAISFWKFTVKCVKKKILFFITLILVSKMNSSFNEFWIILKNSVYSTSLSGVYFLTD